MPVSYSPFSMESSSDMCYSSEPTKRSLTQISHLDPSSYRPQARPTSSSIASYDIPWTGHLIKRDIKVLAKKVAAKTKSKVKKLFSKSTLCTKSAGDGFYYSDGSWDRVLLPPDDPDSPSRRAYKEKVAVPDMPKISREADPSVVTLSPPEAVTRHDQPCGIFDIEFAKEFADSESIESTPASTPASTPTDFESIKGIRDSEFIASALASTPEDTENLYKIISVDVKRYWDHRPKDLEGEERWLVRGLAVFMNLAVLNCPSNPVYADVEFNHQLQLINVLLHTTLRDLKAIIPHRPCATAKASKVPVELFEGEGLKHFRIDSLMPEGPGSSCPDTQVGEGIEGDGPPSAEHLWYSLMVACGERSNTFHIVEGILKQVDPEMDVRSFLLRMGDPAQMVGTEEQAELRNKLRNIFFPEFDTLC
ncbi:hypothetical protein K504DRAFT_530887 [Pleomassaria siparia CBS 279.74]|uniref:Uncharacterized protein n=1 Tax=Pleomassaria siparia CBS 279.74 TaxID=1314801 RepID=A0A6G1KMZ0_9PLEO|nr:hypothetical protein K504DRAFT_530887 [Pleomassaria siparia CBS 279.74]